MITQEHIDRGAAALRLRQQGGKKIRDWKDLHNSDKKKWREYAAIVLKAAMNDDEGYREIR